MKVLNHPQAIFEKLILAAEWMIENGFTEFKWTDLWFTYCTVIDLEEDMTLMRSQRKSEQDYLMERLTEYLDSKADGYRVWYDEIPRIKIGELDE